MNTWVMVIRERGTENWTAVAELFANGDACDRHFFDNYRKTHDSARWYDMGSRIRNFHGDAEVGDVIRINERGAARVLNGKAGMTFTVERVTKNMDKRSIAHVLDLRYPDEGAAGGYQCWSIGPDGYDVL